MAESRVSVYVQLPGNRQKSLAGEFTWKAGTSVGSFVYEDSYRKQNGYFLDPVVLKLRPKKEVRNNGIYGVFRDAGPDAWGGGSSSTACTVRSMKSACCNRLRRMAQETLRFIRIAACTLTP